MRTSTKISEAYAPIPRRRGRPRNFDRDTVLRAALQRFRTHGFAATSLDDLASATGIARPSLYATFGDKRALYLEALDRTYEWLAETFAGLHAANLPFRKVLRAIFRSSIDTFMTGELGPSGCIAINTAVAEAVTDPEIRASLARILALEDDEIEKALAQAGSPSPRAHALIVTSVMHSLSVRARAGEPREALERIAAECVELIAGAA
jgi:AcrR family transcriptional regulator